MASANDFKILNQKCSAYFDILENELGREIKVKKNSDKERFGFYIYSLECICNIKDTLEIVDLITDTDFNAALFGKGFNDHGIDAISIDEETNAINLFNFKFRENFNQDKEQSLNETIISTKFANSIINNESSHLQGKLKIKADEILKHLNSKEVWTLKLYVVSNENVELDTDKDEIQQLEKAHDLEVIPIALPQIANFMSARPKAIDASLVVDNDSIMSYSETDLSSAKSFVVRITVAELIRITCDKKSFREQSNMENITPLASTGFEYALLFDNVRGFLGETKYNKNIIETLKTEPTKFFMYNNGLTITAENIESDLINAGRKAKIKIENFQVVNGGQTLRSIHKFNSQDKDNLHNFLSNCEILIRIFKTGNTTGLINKIAEYTNSQNAISVIDLKSLAIEQIQIEQFLDENNIIYARKIGDTGISSSRSYEHKITMEKFAQILYALKGFPEKVSNQKKAIFEKHYNSVFGEANFKIEESAKIVKRYYEIKKVYETTSKKFQSSDQKIFYIFYLDQFFDSNTKKEIDFLEETLREYKIDNEEEISPARKLIQTKFKDFLDKRLEDIVISA